MAKTSRDAGRLILVTGASGHQGSAVLRHLHERGFPIRALTRDPEKPSMRALAGEGIEVIRGDLDDRDSVRRAVDGVYGVYSVQESTHGAEVEIRQGANLADAAARANVGHFIYSSVGSADQHTGIPHFDSKFRIEEHVRRTGLSYTIFRPVFFMENWLGMKETIAKKKIALPLSSETRLQMIAVDNIGAFVATAFEHSGKWQARAVDIASDELSMNQVAEALTRATGSQVQYQQVPWPDFESRAGHEVTLMFRWFEDVGYHIDISALRVEYPNLTTTFERWLHTHWPAAQAQTA